MLQPLTSEAPSHVDRTLSWQAASAGKTRDGLRQPLLVLHSSVVRRTALIVPSTSTRAPSSQGQSQANCHRSRPAGHLRWQPCLPRGPVSSYLVAPSPSSTRRRLMLLSMSNGRGWQISPLPGRTPAPARSPVRWSCPGCSMAHPGSTPRQKPVTAPVPAGPVGAPKTLTACPTVHSARSSGFLWYLHTSRFTHADTSPACR